MRQFDFGWKRVWARGAGLSLILQFIMNTTEAAEGAKYSVYFGTSTRNGVSQGIYRAVLDTATGRVSEPELAGQAVNPGFLAIHPNGKLLYSIGEVEVGAGGGVTAWAIESGTGRLKRLNQQVTGGKGPTHLIVDPSGRNVLAANYGGGSIACLPIGEDGALKPLSAFVQHVGSSVNPDRQKEPHAHGIYTDKAGRYVFVPDLGLDRVKVYRFDASVGGLTALEAADAKVPPGSGPRHFAFHPEGRLAWVINEMLCTVTGFRYEPERGTLSEIETVSTLPEGVAVAPTFSTAEIFVHPNGRFLYGSNRGHDTLAVYAIAKDGRLARVENAPTLSKTPRGFGIDPSGRFLIVGGQDSNDATVFRVDGATGRLTPTGQQLRVGSPICVEFLAQAQEPR